MNKILHTNNLLASIAVFAELCDTENDMQSILTEFVKSIFVLEKTFSLESTEATLLLKKHYDFDLPEAVVKICLNGLTTKGFTVRKNNKYALVDESYNINNITVKLNEKKDIQGKIENDLIDYCEDFFQKKIISNEKKEIIDGFISYLMDNGVTDKYSAVISSFIIENSMSEKFISELNQIKEGLVLITGLTFTSDLNSVGSWDEEITIYLDTEHLFNSAGFNGEVYKTIFNDFYLLVSEINLIAMKKWNKKLIHLKFFDEVKKEVDRFFNVAQKIVKREDNASPENIAMETICKGCESVSDIIRKKAQFETNLLTRGITIQEELDYYSKPEYNVEDAQLLEKYKEKFEEHEIAQALKNFTKINFHRKGNNRTNFERCKHIILTGRSVTLILSKDLEIKNEAKDIPFATDIYFITNRIWYRLNKGLSKTGNLPATLDVVIKAQVILSSQLNKSIGKQYEKLKTEVQNGSLNKESAQFWYYNLREQTKKPEEINFSNVEQSIDLIFENDFDNYLKEKANLEQKAHAGEEALKELNKIRSKVNRNKKKPKKYITRFLYSMVIIILLGIIIFIPISITFLINYLKSNTDTKITILGVCFTILIEILGLLKYIKPIMKRVKVYFNNHYLDSIKNL
jgi:hypothetical protein